MSGVRGPRNGMSGLIDRCGQLVPAGMPTARKAGYISLRKAARQVVPAVQKRPICSLGGRGHPSSSRNDQSMDPLVGPGAEDSVDFAGE